MRFHRILIALFSLLITSASYSQLNFEKGKLFFQKSDFDSASACFISLISSCKYKCHDSILGVYETYLGKTYSMMEDYEKSLFEFEHAIYLMQSTGNFNGMAFAQISLAEMYRRAEKFDKAKKEIDEVFELHAKHNLSKNNQAYMYNRYAAIVSEIDYVSDTVFAYSNKVLDIVKQTGNLDLKASSLNELGYYEEKNERLDLAERYYKEAYQIYNLQSNKIYIAQMFINLSRLCLHLRKLDECEEYLKRGIKLTENTNWYNIKASLYGSYSTLLYSQARYKESREILGKFIDIQMAKMENQQSRALLELESKYESNKKSVQIELEKQKSKLAKSETIKKTQQRNYISISVVILFILLILLFLSYRKIKRTNASLSISLIDRELLLKEVNHRVKNNLQVISSLLELQAEHTQDENSKRKLIEGRNRINSISHVHELIYSQDKLVNLCMEEYITLLSNEVKESLWKEVEGNVKISCDNIELGITEAIPVGILLNELLMNSFKHAKPPANLIEIIVMLEKNNDEINFLYRDNGQDGIYFSNGKIGIGTTVINGMVRQLHAKSEVLHNKGFQFQMIFKPQLHGKNSYS